MPDISSSVLPHNPDSSGAMAMLLDMITNAITPRQPPTTLFTDKTVLITGANTGIGLEAARYFVQLEARRVILAVRLREKGEAARKDIEASTGRLGVVQVVRLDMGSYDSIHEFIEELDRDVDRLDVVILNAGVIEQEYRRSQEGWENTLQVNTISTALLTLLLLPRLVHQESEKGDFPRLIIVSSILYRNAKLDQVRGWTTRNLDARRFSGLQQYALSKLLALYVMRELTAQATDEKGHPKVLITACCPGLCSSQLYRSFSTGVLGKIIYATQKVFGNSPEKASRTLVRAVGLGTEAHGEFWNRDALLR